MKKKRPLKIFNPWFKKQTFNAETSTSDSSETAISKNNLIGVLNLSRHWGQVAERSFHANKLKIVKKMKVKH